MEKILVIDDDESIRVLLNVLLAGSGCKILNAESGSEGIQIIENEHPDLIITDLAMPQVTGLDVLKKAKEIDESVPLIILTAFGEMTSTIKAIQLGAYDYLSKPIDQDKFNLIVKRALETKRLKDDYILTKEKNEEHLMQGNYFIGNSPGVKEIFKQIGLVSMNKVTILLQGESGTGKELVSRIIHSSGITKSHPVVAVNCSALTETLLESELFGHVKGAFTGAIRDKKGKFEMAGDGTIFLDEISEISLNLQVKLLRIIQEKEFERVGGETLIPVKARIITSTNKDLAQLVNQGKFREDLYFRLKVFTITIPPLRNRKEDIPQLVVHFLAKINKELHKNVNIVPYEVMEMLQNYEWIGNVRELENILTQAVVLAKGNVLEKDYLILKNESLLSTKEKDEDNFLISLAELEKNHIKKILDHLMWNKKEALKVLGISKSTLYKKIEEYGIKQA